MEKTHQGEEQQTGLGIAEDAPKGEALEPVSRRELRRLRKEYRAKATAVRKARRQQIKRELTSLREARASARRVPQPADVESLREATAGDNQLSRREAKAKRRAVIAAGLRGHRKKPGWSHRPA